MSSIAGASLQAQMFIDGRWTAPVDDGHTVENPADGLTIAVRPAGDVTTARLALEAAHGAQRLWALCPAVERGGRPSTRLPHGVVVGLTVWNYPLALAATKLGPALVVGNASILMAHEFTPSSGLVWLWLWLWLWLWQRSSKKSGFHRVFSAWSLAMGELLVVRWWMGRTWSP